MLAFVMQTEIIIKILIFKLQKYNHYILKAVCEEALIFHAFIQIRSGIA